MPGTYCYTAKLCFRDTVACFIEDGIWQWWSSERESTATSFGLISCRKFILLTDALVARCGRRPWSFRAAKSHGLCTKRGQKSKTRSVEDVCGMAGDTFGKSWANWAHQWSEIAQKEPWNFFGNFTGRKFILGRGSSRCTQIYQEIPSDACSSAKLPTICRAFCWQKHEGTRQGTWCFSTTCFIRIGPRCFVWRSSWKAFPSGSRSSTTYRFDSRESSMSWTWPWISGARGASFVREQRG